MPLLSVICVSIRRGPVGPPGMRFLRGREIGSPRAPRGLWLLFPLGRVLILAPYIFLAASLPVLAALPASAPASTGPPPDPTAPPADWTAVTQFSPIESGTGVVVCEPVAQDVATAQFGAGCSRWIEFILGSQPEMGKTPAWTSVNDARRQLGKQDLCLSAADAPKLFDLLGVTHVLTGQISGTAASFSLVYTVTAHPGDPDGGPPLAAAGTSEQILQALPGLARQLLQRLHIENPAIPTDVGASPDDIAFLGRLPRVPETPLSGVDLKRLADLSTKIPLAGLLYLGDIPAEDPADRIFSPPIFRLVTSQGNNPLVMAQVASLRPDWLRPFHDRVLENARRFPRSALAQFAAAIMSQQEKNRHDERVYAIRAVRCAPCSPDLWIVLTSVLTDLVQDLERGAGLGGARTFDEKLLATILKQGVIAAQRAVELAPNSSSGWMNMAAAYYFQFKLDTSLGAIEKAIAADPGNPASYVSALTLVDAGLSGNTEEMRGIVKAAWGCPVLRVSEASSLAAALDTSNDVNPDNGLTDNVVPRVRDRVLAAPDDPANRWLLAMAVRDSGDEDGAIEEFRSLAERQPEDSRAHTELGRALYVKALDELQQAVKLDPDNFGARETLAWKMIGMGRIPDARSAFAEMLRGSPYCINAVRGLAQADCAEGHFEDAARRLRSSLPAIASDNDLQSALAAVLVESGKYEEAARAAREVIDLDPNNSIAHAALGRALLHQKPSEPILEVSSQ